MKNIFLIKSNAITLSFFLVIFLSLSTKAQTLKAGFETDVRFTPKSEAADTNEQIGLKQNETKLLLMADFSSRKKLILIPEYNKYTFTEGTTNNYLKALNFRTIYMFPLSEKTQLRTMIVPKFQAQENIVNMDNFLIEGAFMFSFKKTENFDWQVGLMLGKEFWGPKINPYVGFEWFPIENLKLHLDAPKFHVTYNISNKISTGFFGGGFTTSYASTDNNTYFDEEKLDKLATFEYKPVPFIKLRARIGQSSRIFKEFDMDDKLDFKVLLTEFGDRTPIREHVRSGFVADVGITMYFMKKDLK